MRTSINQLNGEPEEVQQDSGVKVPIVVIVVVACRLGVGLSLSISLSTNLLKLEVCGNAISLVSMFSI